MKLISYFLTLSAASAFAGELVFERSIIEVTALPDDEMVNVDFPFKAVGKSPAVIKRYDAPCSCLEAQISNGGKLAWTPGETGTVRGIFSVGNFRGTIDKNISLVMEDGARHELTVRMTMPELLVIEPKTLRWDVGAEAREQFFTVKVSHDEPIKITGLSGTNDEKFPHTLETVEEGKEYRIRIKVKETNERGFGLLRLSTDSKFKKHQSYQSFMVVAPLPKRLAEENKP